MSLVFLCLLLSIFLGVVSSNVQISYKSVATTFRRKPNHSAIRLAAETRTSLCTVSHANLNLGHSNNFLCPSVGNIQKFVQQFSIEFYDYGAGNNWTFSIILDSGYGFGVYLDKESVFQNLESSNNSVWNISLPSLARGQHNLVIYSGDDCCDSDGGGWQFSRGDSSGWQDLTESALLQYDCVVPDPVYDAFSYCRLIYCYEYYYYYGSCDWSVFNAFQTYWDDETEGYEDPYYRNGNANDFVNFIDTAIASGEYQLCHLDNAPVDMYNANQDLCPGRNSPCYVYTPDYTYNGNPNVFFGQRFILTVIEPVGGVNWTLYYGMDSGLGTAFAVDGEIQFFTPADTDQNWEMTFVLSEGKHQIQVYGAEVCCDGEQGGWTFKRGDGEVMPVTAESFEAVCKNP